MNTNRTLRKLLADSRPAVIASVTGTVLGLSALSAQAQMPLLGPASDRAPAQIEEPRRLPTTSSNPIRPLLAPLALTAGEQPAASNSNPDSSQVQKQLELLYQQNGRPMPQMVPAAAAQPAQNQLRLNNGPQGNVAAPAPGGNQAAPVAQHRPTQEPATPVGFFDKMKSVFKSPAGRNPPVDPGMNYPTYRDGQNQNANLREQNPMARAGQPVQNAANPRQNGPAVPPAQNIGAPRPNLQAGPAAPASARVPGLFAPSAGANPIQQPAAGGLVPPSPHGSPERVANVPAVRPAVPPAKAPTQGIPEIFVPENLTAGKGANQPLQVPPSVNPPLKAANALPKLDLAAPMPAGPQLVPVAPAPAAAPLVNARQASPADPFANLFPEDGPEQANAAAPRVPVPSANEIQQPYSGLALDPNGFEAARLPAPGAPLANGAAQPAGQGLIQVLPKNAGQETAGMALPVPPVAANAPAGQRELPRLELAPAAEVPKLAPALNLPEKKLQNAGAPAVVAPTAGAITRMELIASRPGTGMKGFCPVRLRDQRELVAADPDIAVTFNGMRYEFASEEARADFLKEPARYVPAANGTDIVRLALTGESAPGKLDHAVWYKGRLYLFADVETMEAFVASPSAHALAN